MSGGSNYCNDPAHLCVNGEGDCDSNAQCDSTTSAGPLVCVPNGGPVYGLPAGVDVCAPTSCFNRRLDSGEVGIDCGGTVCPACVGASAGMKSAGGANGGPNYCNNTHALCSNGEGDCDSDAQCDGTGPAGALACIPNQGLKYGLGSNVDICAPRHCADRVKNSDESAVDCGGSCAPCPGMKTTCMTNPCFMGVACTDTSLGRVCDACPSGYSGDGITCTDLNGCDPNPCFTGVACVDVMAPGNGAMCGACPSGYSGDGVVCADINECDPNPCYPSVSCTDAIAPSTGFTCGSCPEGYLGDGQTCMPDLSGCDGNPCSPGSCNPSPGSYSCSCPDGYNNNGNSCDPDLSGCEPNPCYPRVTCTPLPGSFSCGPCPDGLFGDGIDCSAS